jgi:hypothetical protein
MTASWHTEGATWMRVMDLHDQSPMTYEVPQPMKVQTVGWRRQVSIVPNLKVRNEREGGFLRKLPRFHRQLYTVVTGARCWGWMISVKSMGEASWASEFPKPRMQRPAQSTA